MSAEANWNAKLNCKSFLQIILIILFVQLIGCDTSQPVAPLFIKEVQVEIQGLNVSMKETEGDITAIAFEILVIDPLGENAELIPIALWVDDGPGDVIAPEYLTDENGLVEALYYTVFPPNDTTVTIIALAGFDTATARIDLISLLSPDKISFLNREIVSDRNSFQNGLSELHVLVTNRNGIPVPDTKVKFLFRLESFLNSYNTITDNSGKADIDLIPFLEGSEIPDSFWIYASVLHDDSEILSNDCELPAQFEYLNSYLDYLPLNDQNICDSLYIKWDEKSILKKSSENME